MKLFRRRPDPFSPFEAPELRPERPENDVLDRLLFPLLDAEEGATWRQLDEAIGDHPFYDWLLVWLSKAVQYQLVTLDSDGTSTMRLSAAGRERLASLQEVGNSV